MARKVGRRGPLVEPVHVKLSSQQKEQLDAASALLASSPPEVIRRALDDFLARERPRLLPVQRAIRRARERN